MEKEFIVNPQGINTKVFILFGFGGWWGNHDDGDDEGVVVDTEGLRNVESRGTLRS